ncbi:MAG: exodeoxyribonuclease VII small subunit [Lachnospirales bacterium]
MPKKTSFEENLTKLEDIVREMEDIADLDKTITLYKEGSKIAIRCNESIQKYEETVSVLKKELDESFSLEKFNGFEV